jgi:hypothetical protein
MNRTVFALAFLPFSLFAAACAQTTGVTGGAGGVGGQGGQGGDPFGDPICLLSNCNSDEDCGACDGGRNTCRLEDHRCVACDANTATGCPDGQTCSSWGNCVPEGTSCPVDDNDVPMVVCATNADCAACSPLHQVCDPASKACVSCTESNTSYCQSTDMCVDGRCTAKCPSDCTKNSDCNNCANAQGPLPACNLHKCSECSDTYPCPDGQVCTNAGTCVQQCGSDGSGACTSDEDCVGCEGDLKACIQPVNGGPGTCGPTAQGCSDLGSGVVVLPDPWNDYTNTCSDDGDCSGVGVTLNVGKILRDLTGFDEIGDANVSYGMNACANVSVAVGKDDISCGICVPCQADADCQAIDIDPLASDLFGALGGFAASFLLDQIFGPNEHAVQMYCQPVAAGYGVCAPCPGVFTACGGGGGDIGGGSCDHDECTQGGALDPSCGSCAADVCAADAYCCDGTNGAWDNICVNEASDICGLSCMGGGSVCAHDVCATGVKLADGCDSCVTDVCAQDPYCCDTAWDSTCVGEAEQFCGITCGGSTCAHDECVTGTKLTSGCSPCVTDVCMDDPFCCNDSWDTTCVNKAKALCGLSCQ